jgi:hypothetical protein
MKPITADLKISTGTTYTVTTLCTFGNYHTSVSMRPAGWRGWKPTFVLTVYARTEDDARWVQATLCDVIDGSSDQPDLPGVWAAMVCYQAKLCGRSDNVHIEVTVNGQKMVVRPRSA